MGILKRKPGWRCRKCGVLNAWHFTKCINCGNG